MRADVDVSQSLKWHHFQSLHTAKYKSREKKKGKLHWRGVLFALFPPTVGRQDLQWAWIGILEIVCFQGHKICRPKEFYYLIHNFMPTWTVILLLCFTVSYFFLYGSFITNETQVNFLTTHTHSCPHLFPVGICRSWTLVPWVQEGATRSPPGASEPPSAEKPSPETGPSGRCRQWATSQITQYI